MGFERQLVSLDWDIRTLRVVHFAMGSKGGVRIRKVLCAAIPPELRAGDPVAVGQFIRGVLDREHIGAKRMVVDVPRDQAVLNTLRLPNVAEDDLPSVVEYQIGKELPFPLSVAAVDFAVSNGGEDPNYREVLVAAVRLEVLEFYTQVAEAAGLKLERVGLRPYANREAVNELLGDTRRERVLFVDVGPVLTEIDVLRDGKLAFSRAASVGVPRAAETRPAVEKRSLELDLGLRITPAPDAPAPPAAVEHAEPDVHRVVQSLLVEVTRTIEAYRAGDPGAAMDHVVVGGDTGIEDELLEAIKRRFTITGERYNPAPCFGWDAESGLAAGGFAAALGLALGHAVEGRLDFDFAHPKRAVTRTQRRLNRAPMAAAVLIVFLLAGIFGYRNIMGPKQALIAQLKAQLADDEARVKEYKKFQEMIQKIEQLESEQVIWVEELRDLIAVLPEHDQLVLTDVDLDQESAVIQVKMECRGRPVVNLAVSQVNEFKPGGQSRFHATAGTTTDVPGAEFSARSSMKVVLVNRAGRSGAEAKSSGGAQ